MGSILDILRDDWLLLLIGQYPNGPLGGIASTLILSVLGIGLAFPLGIAVALGRLSPRRWLSWPATGLVYTVRGVPLLLLILWVYFLVPLLIGTAVPGFVAMLCTLVIYEGAFLGEVIRGGVQALPRGQTEAARALGHGVAGTMVQVILPQALYNVLPSLLSQFVSTIKETTLGYVINVPELTFAANQINNRLLTKPFQVFAILAMVYFTVCWTLTQLAHRLERRIAARRAGPRDRAGPPAPAASTPTVISPDPMPV